MHRVLVALDASPRARFVLRTAAAIVSRTGGKLVLLRAVGLPPEVEREVMVQAAADIIETMKTRAARDLAALAKEISPSAIESIDIQIGTPWDAICREAASVDADLVVIGSHGYSGLDRLLGTTAAKVVNHCSRSVLVAREPSPLVDDADEGKGGT